MISNCINTNKSVLGKDLIEWITDSSLQSSEEDKKIAGKLYHKYIVDRSGKPKNKIFSDVYYFVNYNDRVNPGLFLAYIVRDKIKSPRKVNPELVELNPIGKKESFKGSIIREWAYCQSQDEKRPFHNEGKELIEKYLNGQHPPRHQAYYFIVTTGRGIQLIRDTEKSPMAL